MVLITKCCTCTHAGMIIIGRFAKLGSFVLYESFPFLLIVCRYKYFNLTVWDLLNGVG